MLRSVLLSSHSSVLMLHFQNFHITKGPTTSAEKYPASTKSVRQPRPRRGETRAFRQLSTDNRGNFCSSLLHGGILTLLQHFAPFFVRPAREGQGTGQILVWRHNVSDLPRTCPRRRGRRISPIISSNLGGKRRKCWGETGAFFDTVRLSKAPERRNESQLVGRNGAFPLLSVEHRLRLVGA